MLRSKSLSETPTETNERRDFYERASHHNLAPLWQVLAGLVPEHPKPKSVAHLWRYQDARRFLIEACSLISAEEAERRVLILENPALQGQSRISESLFCGLQAICPGEVAPAHRHVSGALRFIVEGSKAYTAVDGERTMMLPGDLVITPSWTWHDHGNLGDAPMIWLDTLDMHMINLLNTSFREETSQMQHQHARPDDISVEEFAHGLAPADHKPRHNASPIINYRYAQTRSALNAMAGHRSPDPCLGHIVRYLNPTNGDWALPTIATQMRLLPKGFETAPYRSTDATAFCVVEGQGWSDIDGQTLHWSPGDVFIAPSWSSQVHNASTEAVLYSVSDRAVQEKIGVWREHRSD